MKEWTGGAGEIAIGHISRPSFPPTCRRGDLRSPIDVRAKLRNLVDRIVERGDFETGENADPEGRLHHLITRLNAAGKAILALAEIGLAQNIACEQKPGRDISTVEEFNQLIPG